MRLNYLLLLIAISAVMSSCNNASLNEKKDSATVVLKDTIKKINRHIGIMDSEALKVLDTAAEIEIISEGYKWSEGPVYVPDGDYLLFSDVPSNKVYKWKEGLGAKVFLEPSGYTGTVPRKGEPGSNGLLINKKGQLVLCQHGNRQIAVMKSPLNSPSPVFETIASDYHGKKFNSPNDAVLAANGNLYFTDPPYGLVHGIKDSAKELSFQGVFCIKPNGKVILVTDKVSYPNGIALSPDNKFLYIGNSDGDHKEWTRFELNKEGLPVKESLFYSVSPEEGKLPGSPDGMKTDSRGYLFASGPGGIWLFNESGKVIARIYTGELTSNCSLDQVHHVLYMTCNSYVMRLRLKSF